MVHDQDGSCSLSSCGGSHSTGASSSVLFHVESRTPDTTARLLQSTRRTPAIYCIPLRKMDCRQGPYDQWGPRRGCWLLRVASNDADEAGGPYSLDLWEFATNPLGRIEAACDIRMTRRIRRGRPPCHLLSAAAKQDWSSRLRTRQRWRRQGVHQPVLTSGGASYTIGGQPTRRPTGPSPCQSVGAVPGPRRWSSEFGT